MVFLVWCFVIVKLLWIELHWVQGTVNLNLGHRSMIHKILGLKVGNTEMKLPDGTGIADGCILWALSGGFGFGVPLAKINKEGQICEPAYTLPQMFPLRWFDSQRLPSSSRCWRKFAEEDLRVTVSWNHFHFHLFWAAEMNSFTSFSWTSPIRHATTLRMTYLKKYIVVWN